MTLAELLRDLADAGATLRLADGRIGVKPESVLTPGRVEAIKAHRPAIVALIAGGWMPSSPDAWEVFEERLDIAADLEMDISPGSPAWETAIREARRVEAGVPPALWTRQPGTIDSALAAFASAGMPLTFVEVEAQQPKAEPTGCRACGGHEWWRRPSPDPIPVTPAGPATGWTCGRCHPPANQTKTVWSK